MDKIKLKTVKSSNIKYIGYDEETGTMRVVFVRGNKYYDYPNIKKAEYENLIKAKSIGSAFHLMKSENPNMAKFTSGELVIKKTDDVCQHQWEEGKPMLGVCDAKMYTCQICGKEEVR